MSKNPPSLPTEIVTLGLTERQAAFVREYVSRGGRPGAATAAVLAAGITENRAAARVRASEFLRNPKVLQFLRDELTRKLNAAATLGVGVLEELARTAKSEQVRLGAARELIDRGYGPIVSRNATITARVGIEELLAQLDARESEPARIIEGEVISVNDDASRGT